MAVNVLRGDSGIPWKIRADRFCDQGYDKLESKFYHSSGLLDINPLLSFGGLFKYGALVFILTSLLQEEGKTRDTIHVLTFRHHAQASTSYSWMHMAVCYEVVYRLEEQVKVSTVPATTEIKEGQMPTYGRREGVVLDELVAHAKKVDVLNSSILCRYCFRYFFEARHTYIPQVCFRPLHMTTDALLVCKQDLLFTAVKTRSHSVLGSIDCCAPPVVCTSPSREVIDV